MATVTWISRSDLPGLACPYCGRRTDPQTAWALQAQQAWGRIGVAVSEADTTVGLLLLAPVEAERSAMLMCLWVAPEHVRQGNGRRLVQASAAGMLARDVHSIVAPGSRVRKRCDSPPADFLRSVGFVRDPDDQRASALRPPSLDGHGRDGRGRPGEAAGTRLRRLYRLDLDQTLTERESLFDVLGRWVGSIRPIRPEPAGRVSREG